MPKSWISLTINDLNLFELKMIPFLKWPGGKRWLIGQFSKYFSSQIKGRYIEPFLGSGAVFFHLTPQNALLSDTNDDLITAYQSIKMNWQDVRCILTKYHQLHDKAYYYEIRDSKPQDIIEKAARFIYLNRTCFNGIYRVNKNGKFNVPIGTKSKVILDSDNFEAWAKILKNTQLSCEDFEVAINKAQKEDFIFADPPYTIRHNHNGFIKYNEKLFSWDDQIRLRDALIRAKTRGAHILVTNANHECVKTLYQKGFEHFTLSRFSSISANRINRNTFEELIITA